MDTIKLFLQIKLDINKLKSGKIKWKPNIGRYGVFYNCNYNGVKLVYYCNKFALTLETSATKFLYGDNSVNFELTHLEKLIRDLNFITRITTGQKIISVTEWLVTRLDLANNYYCINEDDKIVYLHMLNELSFSHCEKIKYETSVHAHNKSITYNIYSKSTEGESNGGKYYDNRILRIEFQYKNRTLNRFKNVGTIASKKFKDVINDIPALNSVYTKSLYRLGLDKKFLTKNQLESVLKNLYKNTIITEKLYRNMYDFFINKKTNISKTTLNNYKNILAAHNYSHVLLPNRPSKNIDFLKFNLFDQTRPNAVKVNILSLLFLLLISEEKIQFTSISFEVNTNKFFTIPAFFDDG